MFVLEVANGSEVLSCEPALCLSYFVLLLFPEQFDVAMVEVKVACVVRMRYQLGPTAVPNSVV